MLGRIGLPEMAILLVICLVVFGAGKLPEIASQMGKAIKNFKKSAKEIKEDLDLDNVLNSEKTEGEPLKVNKVPTNERDKVAV